MPPEQPTPDAAALAAAIETDLVFGQVLIRRIHGGFELRHAGDHRREASGLRDVNYNEIRTLAQFSSTGAFRPLKSAPNLPGGWRISAPDDRALGTALGHLYPGAVADWFAARMPPPPVTSYRQFTVRQTGMYRITTLLDDPTAGVMIRACCHQDFCLKRRLWIVEGLPADEPAAKSLIPCLEPCAILLEFARKVTRWEQQETPPPVAQPSRLRVPAASRRGDGSSTTGGTPGEPAGEDACAAPETPPAPPVSPPAECDFDAPDNPRRLRFVLEKQRVAVKPTLG
jgi:hypothetical protein